MRSCLIPYCSCSRLDSRLWRVWARASGRELYGRPAVDISDGICSGAKPIMPDSAQASIVKLPIKSENFDVVIDISTIDHIRHPQVPSVIGEYARVPRPKEILLLCTDSKLSFPWEMYRRILLKYPAYSWMPKQLLAAVDANHFEILQSFFGNTFLDSLFWPLLQHSDSRFYTLSTHSNRSRSNDGSWLDFECRFSYLARLVCADPAAFFWLQEAFQRRVALKEGY